MDLASLSDFEKLQKDSVIKVQGGEDVAYIKIAGPLHFNIIQAMSNKDVTPEQRTIDCMIACLCDPDGFYLFEHGNKKHESFVKNLSYDLQKAITENITEFFGLKKKELKEQK